MFLFKLLRASLFKVVIHGITAHYYFLLSDWPRDWSLSLLGTWEVLMIKSTGCWYWLFTQTKLCNYVSTGNTFASWETPFTQPPVAWSYYSTFTNAAQGVSVLVSHFMLVSVTLARDGRYDVLNCLIFQKPFILLGVYIPPPYFSTVFLKIFRSVASYLHIPCIWLGDFNCAWS